MCYMCAHKKFWTCMSLKMFLFSFFANEYLPVCTFVCLCLCFCFRFHSSSFDIFWLSIFALSAYIYSRSLTLLLLHLFTVFIALTVRLFSLTLWRCGVSVMRAASHHRSKNTSLFRGFCCCFWFF